MKFKTTQNHSTAFSLLSMSIGLMFTQICFATSIPERNFSILPGEEGPVKKSKNKSFYSSNNNSVKIYPDALKRTIHVITKENKGAEIDFFVFDLQANLIKNYKMKENKRIKIQGLARGVYMYRVFCGDEETASGNFEIK